MDIGKKIKIIRENLGLTQEEFADIINKSTSSVKKYENNSGVTVDLLQNIADKLDISVLSLLTDSSDLFWLFVEINNLQELPEEDLQTLEIEFNSYTEFLLHKYKEGV